MKSSSIHNQSAEALAAEIRSGNRVVLSKAITLIESTLDRDRDLGQLLIENLLPKTGGSIRVGITGVPGVGKSTFIEAFGKYITAMGLKIAVLAIDPTSSKTKGSILGDKTRMEELARDSNAFIRPTPSGLTLGGVADRTRETILLCEAAGFDVVLVETVGVGQSEIAVREMVDFFLLLMLAGAGDELQGIKKGIMEMADAILITKADGENIKRAHEALADYRYALNLLATGEADWKPKALTSSALEKKGIHEVWSLINDYIKVTRANNYFYENRSRQNIKWFHESINQQLNQRLLGSVVVKEKIDRLERSVREKKILPTRAARVLVDDFLKA